MENIFSVVLFRATSLFSQPISERGVKSENKFKRKGFVLLLMVTTFISKGKTILRKE